MMGFIALSFVHSRDLKYFYWFKSVYVFIVMHGILIWWMVKAHGVSFTTLASSTKLSRTDHIWLVLRAFNSGLGTASSLTVNQGDMTRYATSGGAAMWVSNTFSQ